MSSWFGPKVEARLAARASGSRSGDEAAFRGDLSSALKRLAEGKLTDGEADALIAHARQFYASKRPAGLSGFITAFKMLTILSQHQNMTDWYGHYKREVTANLDNVGAILDASQVRTFKAAMTRAKKTQDFLNEAEDDQRLLNRDGNLDKSKTSRVLLKPEELYNPLAAKKAREATAAIKEARARLSRAHAAIAFMAKHEDWNVVGGFYGAAFNAAKKYGPALDRELKRANPNIDNVKQLTAALTTGMGAFPLVNGKGEVVQNGSKGARPMTGTQLRNWLEATRTYNLDGLDKAGDIAGCIPGPFGKAMAMGLHGASNGIRYASGDIDGVGFWLRTASNAVDLAIPGIMKGPGSVYTKALKVAGAEAARTFAPKALAIWNRTDLTAEQRAQALEKAFGEAVLKAFVRALMEELGEDLGAAIPNEQKREIADVTRQVAVKLGVDWPLDKLLEQLNELPEKPEP